VDLGLFFLLTPYHSDGWLWRRSRCKTERGDEGRIYLSEGFQKSSQPQDNHRHREDWFQESFVHVANKFRTPIRAYGLL
jgi:hypothetical protein